MGSRMAVLAGRSTGRKDLQMDRAVDYVTRYTKLVICLGTAAVMIWRANSYVDPHGPSIIPTLMCTAFATALTFTGFALCGRDQE
jgi:hypothetical protein